MQGVKPQETRAERYLNRYALSHQDPVNKVIHYICIPLLMFSLFGLFWAIPFPHFKFLGIYNGYFNWASFAIAVAVYYYLRISPLISYTILFIMLGFSYVIMMMLSWQTLGGPAMWLICVIIFIPSACLLLIGNKREKTFPEYGLNITSLPVAPVHILYKVLKLLRINK
nr:Mpo1-like protein [Mucilaginibacter sp. FT3.2]